MNLLLKLILIALITRDAIAYHHAPTTEIKQGRLLGELRKSTNGRTYSAFIGIPYAKPPVGELRFKPPVAAGAWTGVLNATQPQAMCPQINAVFSDFVTKGNEDCLYLNVYTPKASSKKLPVMFYIHCGGFMWGNSYPDTHGPGHFLDKDIVVVSASYRLGALGFLSTGDEVVPGNNGLKDQNLALKWTWGNIEHFGGDPKQITVFGQSAGAYSSHLHMLSPLSKDLIKGVIANSGSAFASLTLSSASENQVNSRKLAEFFNCPSNSSIEMVECLREVDAYSIVNQERRLYDWSYIPIIPYKPVIEPNHKGAFLTEHPRNIVKFGKPAKVPLLIGITRDDGTLLSGGAFKSPEIIDDLYNRFDTIFPKIFGYENTAPFPDEVTDKIRERYFNGTRTVTPSTFTKCITDAWFQQYRYDAVQTHTRYNSAPVYQYSFNYRGSRSFSEAFGTKLDFGVSHCDDLLYLITTDYIKDFKPNQDDKDMIKLMVNLWTNFVITGNPTPPESNYHVPATWHPVTTDHLECMIIHNATSMQMDRDLYLDEIKFWKALHINAYENYLIKNKT